MNIFGEINNFMLKKSKDSYFEVDKELHDRTPHFI